MLALHAWYQHSSTPLKRRYVGHGREAGLARVRSRRFLISDSGPAKVRENEERQEIWQKDEEREKNRHNHASLKRDNENEPIILPIIRSTSSFEAGDW